MKKTSTEQTVLAKMLGMSNKSFRKMLHHAKFDTPENYEIINGKRHYKMADVIEIIKKAK